MGLERRVPGLLFALSGKGMRELPFDDNFDSPGRACGERGDGDRGEFGDGEVEVDFEVTRRKVGPLDGDLERERRSCSIVEFGSD